MNKLINKEKLQYTMTQLWAKAKSTFAKVNGENTFSKSNTFEDAVMLKRVSMYTHSPINSDRVALTGMNKSAGYRNLTSHSNGNKGYVQAVRLRVADSFSIGSIINQVSLWSVEKKDSLAEDEVIEQIYNRAGGFVVKGDNIFPRYIELPVKKTYATETYFIVGHNNSISYTKTLPEDDENVIYTGEKTIPSQGVGIPTTHKRFILQYGLIAGNMNVAVELEKLANTAGDFVSSVNEVKPDEKGNVSIAPSNIPGLLSVNNKIHPDLIPDVAITNVSVVNSEKEAMDLSSHIGDIVVRTDLQGESYICKNPQADTFAERFVRIGSASDAVKTINGESATAGNVNLGLDSDGTQIKLTVNSHVVANLPIITEQEVNTIINSLS